MEIRDGRYTDGGCVSKALSWIFNGDIPDVTPTTLTTYERSSSVSTNFPSHNRVSLLSAPSGAFHPSTRPARDVRISGSVNTDKPRSKLRSAPSLTRDSAANAIQRTWRGYLIYRRFSCSRIYLMLDKVAAPI